MGPLMLAPRGDGHRVLVLPGLGGGDGSTAPLRHYLDWLGYTTLPWELGTNRGITRMWPLLTERIHAILDPLDRSESLSLVGWSLGGTLALGLSFALPRRIRRVITLGSPQVPASGMAAPWVRAGYRMMNATRVGFSDLLDDWPLPRRSPPHTAIYSKTDAIVPWTLAMGGDDVAERIEVLGSHLGLGVNPAVLYAVADRLAAKDNAPFRPPLLLTALYPPIPAPGRPPGTS
jgi:pimeloyl-ACP methyl ester carboxylesterase